MGIKWGGRSNDDKAKDVASKWLKDGVAKHEAAHSKRAKWVAEGTARGDKIRNEARSKTRRKFGAS